MRTTKILGATAQNLVAQRPGTLNFWVPTEKIETIPLNFDRGHPVVLILAIVYI